MSGTKLVSPCHDEWWHCVSARRATGLKVSFSFRRLDDFLAVGGQVKNSRHLIAASFGAGGREGTVSLYCWLSFGSVADCTVLFVLPWECNNYVMNN